MIKKKQWRLKTQLKVGDKIICLDDGPYDALNVPTHLTKYKQYTVLSRTINTTYDDNINIMNDDGKTYGYKISRFMLYEEWLALEREKQIKSILDD